MSKGMRGQFSNGQGKQQMSTPPAPLPPPSSAGARSLSDSGACRNPPRYPGRYQCLRTGYRGRVGDLPSPPAASQRRRGDGGGQGWRMERVRCGGGGGKRGRRGHDSHERGVSALWGRVGAEVRVGSRFEVLFLRFLVLMTGRTCCRYGYGMLLVVV